MSRRARKFIKFMEDNFDWNCIDRRSFCDKCKEKTIGLGVKFCAHCGEALPKNVDMEKLAIEEVEAGLKKVFGEPND